MAAPYEACVIYQKLAEYLRDRMAGELAELRGTTVEAERARLDAIIREWFFTPQRDLNKLSPRDIIRQEELGQPNPLPPPSPDDDEITLEMREMDELFGGETHWHLDDGGFSLLDEYDPEGYEAYWRVHGVKHASDEEPPPGNEDALFSRN